MPKNLPIQFVETRGEQDVFLKEGGGSSELPKWVTTEIITRNVTNMRASLTALGALFDAREADGTDDLPLLAVATLHERATAKSYRANARDLFDGKRKRNVIGVDSPRDLLVKIDNKDELLRISRNYSPTVVAAAGKVKQFGLAVISNIHQYHPHLDENLIGHPIKIRLIDYQDNELNEKSERLFLRKCEERNLNVRKVNYAQDVRMFCISDIQDDASIRALATMDAVLSVKNMPYIELSITPEPLNTQLDVKNPIAGETYPIAGLLDSGIDDVPHLLPWIDGGNQNIAGFVEEDFDFKHGTAVAGILNYGDDLEQQPWTGCSPMKLVSCIVNTDPDNARVQEVEMIEHIRSAVMANPDVKVWNLSQGSTFEVTDNAFSDFAIALDSIQKEHNVLICKSAGNIKPEKPNEERISQGAESMLSLVVGSIADRYEFEGDAQPGERSPFSRKGPGPEFLVKPDLVHYGGNRHAKIQSFSITGYQCQLFSGTSFSTPRVTALAANLAHRINKDFDPTLVKALLVHHSSYQNTVGLDNSVLLNEQGYGLPSDLNTMLNNDADEFTMIWQPSLNVGDAQIQDVPFPSSMVGDDGLLYGDITVTVVSDPILKATEGTEYCQSDVEVLLQTYDDINYVPLNAVGISSYYRNSERLVNAKNVLAKELYSSRSWKSNDYQERTLIESERKYQPIKKYHVNLEMMRPSSRTKWLTREKKWCLSVKARYRDAMVTDRDYDGVVEHTRATIIITIKDQKHKGSAYRECYTSLDEHNFVHSNIDIQQRIEVVNQQ
jgi:hypothetical protein